VVKSFKWKHLKGQSQEIGKGCRWLNTKKALFYCCRSTFIFIFDHVFVAKMIKKNMTSRLFISMVLCWRSVLAGEHRSLAVCERSADQFLPVSHWPLEDLLAGYWLGICLTAVLLHHHWPGNVALAARGWLGTRTTCWGVPHGWKALDQLIGWILHKRGLSN